MAKNKEKNTEAPTEAPDNFAEQNETAQALAIPETATASQEPTMVSDPIDKSPDDANGESAKTSTENQNVNADITNVAKTQSVLDLPDDVKKNIIGFEELELEELLLKCISLYPTACTVDRIIMTLWHSYKRNYDRARVMRKIRSLTIEGKLLKMDGTRGLYCLTALGKSIITSLPAA